MSGIPIESVMGSFAERADAIGGGEHAERSMQAEKVRNRTADMKAPWIRRSTNRRWRSDAPKTTAEPKSYSWQSKSFSALECQTFSDLLAALRVVRVDDPGAIVLRLRGFLARLHNLDLRHCCLLRNTGRL